MEVIGKIKHIGQTKQVSASFSKRELVITTQEQYPQSILIEFHQDKCNLLDGLLIGTPVIVSINLRGREWTNPQGETKYFNSIQGWRISANNHQQVPTYQPQPQSAVDNYHQNHNQKFNNVQNQAGLDFNPSQDNDDLPF